MPENLNLSEDKVYDLAKYLKEKGHVKYTETTGRGLLGITDFELTTIGKEVAAGKRKLIENNSNQSVNVNTPVQDPAQVTEDRSEMSRAIETSYYDLDKLFSYVSHATRYREKLEKAINNGLWEYAAVLIWKNVILFIYEKLFQIKAVGNNLPDGFDSQLDSSKITVHSCFDFCCINDNKICDKLNEIWDNVEKNYKHLFKGLLDERNSLSHVNKYEEDFNELWLKRYFDRSISLLEYLQNLNNIQRSQKIYDLMESNKTVRYFSDEDIKYLLSQSAYENSKIIQHLLDFIEISNCSENLKNWLKNKAINAFLDSHSFSTAFENGKRIVNLAPCYNKKDVKTILSGVFERQKSSVNQIIFSGNIEYVFGCLFDKTINLEGLEEDWRRFLEEVSQYGDEYYSRLKERFPKKYNGSDKKKTR